MLLLIVYFLTFSIKSLYHIFYRGKIEMYHRYLFLLPVTFFIRVYGGFFILLTLPLRKMLLADHNIELQTLHFNNNCIPP